MAPKRVRQSPLERIVTHFISVPMPDAEAALATVTAIVRSRRAVGTYTPAATERAPRTRRTAPVAAPATEQA